MPGGLLSIAVFVALGGLCLLLAWVVTQHGLLFFREMRGARKLSTLAGAAAVIAIIINMLVGTFTQPAPSLTPPPPPKAAADHIDGLQAPHAP